MFNRCNHFWKAQSYFELQGGLRTFTNIDIFRTHRRPTNSQTSYEFIDILRIPLIGVRGSPERDISSLRAFGPGGGQIWRVVHVSARAPFGVLGGHRCLAYAKGYFWGGICKSRPEPIGVRGFYMFVGRFFFRFWAVVREPKRKNGCKMLLISYYVLLCCTCWTLTSRYFLIRSKCRTMIVY